MTDSRLGVLLLSGVRHQAAYAARFGEHPRLKIVALADEPDLPDWMDALNASLANRLEIPYLRDIDAALARPDVQVVSVCPEPTRHARLAACAAMTGRHVLVDKPLGLTIAECDLVARAVGRGGGKLAVVHRLFSPALQRLRQLIDSGELGLPWAVHVTWLSAAGFAEVVENEALVADPQLSGGGELANFLTYPVGYIRYLTGLEVESVYAVTATHSHAAHARFGVEDFAVLQLTLARGVLASITVGRLTDGAAPGNGVFSIRVHGSHGSAMVDEERPSIQLFSRTGGHARRDASGAGEQALRALIDDFVGAIDADRAPLSGVDDARACAAVLQAAYQSAACGDVVVVGR